MQALTRPNDGEWLAAQAITELSGIKASANPPERVDGSTPCAQVTQLGCHPVAETLWRHDLSIDVWAGTAPDWADAWAAAADVASAIERAGLGQSSHGWRTASITNVYSNPDTNRPDVPRVTIAASIDAPGVAII